MLYFNLRQHLRLLVFTYVTFSLTLAHSTEGWLPTFFLSVCLRDFLEHDLVDFASKHPSVVVYVKPRRHRSSVIKAEYCESLETPFTTLCFSNHIAFNHFTSLSHSNSGNGEEFWMSAHKMNREEIRKWLHLCTTQNDGTEFRFRKHMHTDNPSIQGPWTPFTHRNPELNTASFPHVRYF